MGVVVLLRDCIGALYGCRSVIERLCLFISEDLQLLESMKG